MLSFNVTVTLPEEETDFVVGSVELSNDLPVVQLSLGSLDLTNAMWSSSDESVAVVDQEGTVTAVGSGSCTVTASVDGKNYIVNITSTYEQQAATDPVTEVELGSVEFSNGSSSVAITLNGIPDGTTVQWSSTDESVAVVDQEGVVTAVGSGSCQIIALIDGVKYITHITSTYDPSLVQTDTVVLGEITLTNENYSSTITLSGVPDGTTIQWSSSDESVAVVDQEGAVTAVGSGSCQIIALINGVNYVMNVTSEYAPAAAIEIYAESTEISEIGNTLALTVLNTDETPEWISTDINVSTVDENGIITAVGEGTVLIIAKINDVPYTITITVKSDVLYGDANLSGDINISDAVTILSYVSNSDKYALSEQQIDAADVYMRGDGLNNMDALSVQKFISNNLSALPESYT